MKANLEARKGPNRAGSQPAWWVVGDGSYVGALYGRGFYVNRLYDALCLDEPEVIEGVLGEFVRAGAGCLRTPSFQSSGFLLEQYGQRERQEEILRASSALCRHVWEKTQTPGHVAGVLGPSFAKGVSVREIERDYEMRAKALAESVDSLELYASDLAELQCAARAVAGTKLPLVVYQAWGTGDAAVEYVNWTQRTPEAQGVGFVVEGAFEGVAQWYAQNLKSLIKGPVFFLLGALGVREHWGQCLRSSGPESFSKLAKRLYAAGVQGVGGWSGAEASEIKAIANAARHTCKHRHVITQEPCSEPHVPGRSAFAKALGEGAVWSVELVPPKGADMGVFLERCQALVEGGVGFVNIPESAMAQARMGSLHAAVWIKARVPGLEPVPHYTGRDRNLIGIQGDLLGAHANGVRNVLFVTGDPPKLGSAPGATGVYDCDAVGLVDMASALNRGVGLGGAPVPGDGLELVAGAALNPMAQGTAKKKEEERLWHKMQKGAQFVVTQPVYDVKRFKEFMCGFKERYGVLPAVVMGVWPLVSLRNAEFLQNEVPGAYVPQWVVDEMKKAKGDKDEAIKRGMDVAVRIIQEAQQLDCVKGFQVSAPFNKAEVALSTIAQARGA